MLMTRSRDADLLARLQSLAPGAVAVALALSGHAMGCVVMLVLGTGMAIAPRKDQLVLSLPTAGLVVIASIVGMAQLSPLVGLHPLRTVWSSRVLLVVLGIVVAGVGWLWPNRHGRTLKQNWALAIPAAFMAMLAVVIAILPTGKGTGWMLRMDNIAHLMLVKMVRDQGGVEYVAGDVYPRGWHALVALLWSGQGTTVGGDGLDSLVHCTAVAYWALYALVVLATSIAAFSMAQRVHLGDRTAIGVGVGAGSTLLWPPFTQNLPLGFQTLVLGALILAVTMMELSRRPGQVLTLIVAASGCALITHTRLWIMPGEVCLLGAAVWMRVRAAGLRRAGALVALVAIPALASSAPPVLGALRSAETVLVSDKGYVPPMPWTCLMLVAIGAGLGAIHARKDVAVVAALLAPIVLTLFAIGRALYAHQPLTQYYSAKLLWQAMFCAVPIAATGWTAFIVKSVVHPDRTARMARVIWPPAVVALVVSAILPVAGLMGRWNDGVPSLALRAATSPGAALTQAVFLDGHPGESTVARQLVDFYRAERGYHSTDSEIVPVTRECAWLAPSAPPAVLTDAPARARQRYQCARGLVIVPTR